MAMRLPTPAPLSSQTTISSACGSSPRNSASDNGTTSRRLAPAKDSCHWLSVTVPITLAIRMVQIVLFRIFQGYLATSQLILDQRSDDRLLRHYQPLHILQTAVERRHRHQ